MLQSDLSIASGVPLSTYRKFERTGIISLMGFIKIGIALGAEKELDALFNKRPKKHPNPPSKRQRARKKGSRVLVTNSPGPQQ